MKGFEPQTLEAINILKEYKTPFVVVANKIDLITGWRATGSNSLAEALKKQNESVQAELDARRIQDDRKAERARLRQRALLAGSGTSRRSWR